MKRNARIFIARMGGFTNTRTQYRGFWCLTNPAHHAVGRREEKVSVKLVRITLEMDPEFIKHLQTTISLSGLGNLEENYKQHTALDALGVVALAEARGALEEQVHALTPIEWRPHIQAIHDLRTVEESHE